MSEDKAESKGILDSWKWLLDAVKPKIKEFLLAQMGKLDEMVLKSPNKIDDLAWGTIRPIIVAWISAL